MRPVPRVSWATHIIAQSTEWMTLGLSFSRHKKVTLTGLSVRVN